MHRPHQTIQAIRRSIPEEHKQHILVLLGQMITHYLIDPNITKDAQARTGREPLPTMMRHEGLAVQRNSCEAPPP